MTTTAAPRLKPGAPSSFADADRLNLRVERRHRRILALLAAQRGIPPGVLIGEWADRAAREAHLAAGPER